MSKNDKTLVVGDIEEEKKKLEGDLAKLQDQLQQLEKVKIQTQANANAIMGAIQQCDVFLKMVSSPDSSIPEKTEAEQISAIKTALG
jgi:predicted ribosome quality control (RQC) complex YloA/Tae2 family protein